MLILCFEIVCFGISFQDQTPEYNHCYVHTVWSGYIGFSQNSLESGQLEFEAMFVLLFSSILHSGLCFDTWFKS